MVYQSIPENETLNFFFYVVHAVACLNLTKPLVVCASYSVVIVSEHQLTYTRILVRQ